MSLIALLNKKSGKQIVSSPLTNLFERKEIPQIVQKQLTSKKKQSAQQQKLSASQKFVRPQKDPDQPERTIFVGNVPVATKKKQIIKHFQGFGQVVKVRFRSAQLQQNKLPRKANFVLGNFQDKQGGIMNAYVTFKEKQNAVKARAEASDVFQGNHIRITMQNEKPLDYDRTVFIGNLPFAVKDEALRQFFSQCGQIESVRVIRNAQGQGIGIGYVTGANKQVLENMRNLNGKFFMERQLRIKKAVPKARMEKKQRWRQKKHEEYLNLKEQNSKQHKSVEQTKFEHQKFQPKKPRHNTKAHEQQ